MGRSELCAALCAALLAFASGCRVDVPEDAVFSCETDADCGGNGYTCVQRTGLSSVCCIGKPETCNGLDDDCDGLMDEAVTPKTCYSGQESLIGVGICQRGQQICQAGTFVESCAGEVLPRTETCNTLDDDCDGQTDEDFDLTTDLQHCGQCDNACAADERCAAGACKPSSETSCEDGVDNDEDSLEDCEDPDCDARSCGTGCVCGNGVQTESACNDALDNDDDLDDDCEDTDCAGKICSAAPLAYTCDAQQACTCGGTLTPAPEALCTDGVDEDCDGATDCADTDCDAQTCGAGCICANQVKKELSTACGDFMDNDGDAMVDCADQTDCPQGTACQYMQGQQIRNGTCNGNGQCR